MESGGLTAAWKALPGVGKLIAIGLVVVLLFIGANGIGKTVESIRASRFDQKQQQHEKDVAALNEKIQALIRRAEIAEAKAQLAEQKAETLEVLNKQQGARVNAAAEKVEAAFNAFENDNSVTGADVPDDVRRARICAKRKELGFPCGK
jgi:DNA repair exonuclease SbcCD ATPase subunit